MPDAVDVSVIISTYNRSAGILATLDALSRQETRGCSYEVIVVDNNSNDDTAAVVRAFIAAGRENVTYLFEPEPGVSHGRNTGIRAARAPILAFTDDDLIVEWNWVATIKQAMDAHPHVDYVTGRMLPACTVPPPPWLAAAAHGPCVLRDRGDRPLFSTRGCFFPGWATANIAFRRGLFERVGLFSGDFPRGQDLEFIIRVWQAQGCGMYAPDMVVHHMIPAERMTKAYHRMWHTREGDIRARVRYWETVRADGRVLQSPLDAPTWFGVPRFIYRQLGAAVLSWLGAVLRLDSAQAFQAEGQVRQIVSYMRSRRRIAGETRAVDPAARALPRPKVDRTHQAPRPHSVPAARRLASARDRHSSDSDGCRATRSASDW